MTNTQWSSFFVNMFIRKHSKDIVYREFLNRYSSGICFDSDYEEMQYAIDWLNSEVFSKVSLWSEKVYSGFNDDDYSKFN